MKVVWQFYLYWLLVGIMPSFSGVSYFLIKDVYKISDLQYGILSVISTLSMLFGVAIYQMWFVKYDFRTLCYISLAVGILSNFVDLLQFNRVNIEYGISDMALICFGSGVIGTFQFAMTQLPCLVLFQKMAPEHVESTVMAFSASIVNLSRGFLGELTGAYINKQFIGIDGTNVGEKFYIIIYLGFFMAIYNFYMIKLIPLQKEITEVIK